MFRKTVFALFAVCLLAFPSFVQAQESLFQPRFDSITSELEGLQSDLVGVEQSLADVTAAINRFREAIGATSGTDPDPDPSVDEPLIEASTAEARPDISVDREKIAEEIIQAAKDSDLSRLQKRRVERVMNAKRGRLAKIKEQAIDVAAEEMLTAGVVVVTPDGVEAAVDWVAVFEFFKTQVLPLVLQIISWYGG